MTALGSAKEKSIVVRAAGAIVIGDIENMDCIRSVSRKAVKDYPNYAKRNIALLGQFLRDDVLSTILALLESRRTAR